MVVVERAGGDPRPRKLPVAEKIRIIQEGITPYQIEVGFLEHLIQAGSSRDRHVEVVKAADEGEPFVEYVETKSRHGKRHRELHDVTIEIGYVGVYIKDRGIGTGVSFKRLFQDASEAKRLRDKELEAIEDEELARANSLRIAEEERMAETSGRVEPTRQPEPKKPHISFEEKLRVVREGILPMQVFRGDLEKFNDVAQATGFTIQVVSEIPGDPFIRYALVSRASKNGNEIQERKLLDDEIESRHIGIYLGKDPQVPTHLSFFTELVRRGVDGLTIFSRVYPQPRRK
jgi:hypothetical protein